MSTPRGMGVYLRAMDTTSPVMDKWVQRLIECKVKWAAIATVWHEKGKIRWLNTPREIARMHESLIRAGIAPYLWGYPWHSTIQKFADNIEDCLIYNGQGNCCTFGILLDPELGLRKHPKEAHELVTRMRVMSNSINIVQPDGSEFSIGFTSYWSMVKDFPWDEFAVPGVFNPTEECDYGSMQVYECSPEQIIKAAADYKNLGFEEIVPSFGLYKTVITDGKRVAKSKTPSELNAHFQAFALAKPKFKAMIGWSENFITPSQVPIIAQWSELLDRGALALKSCRVSS